MIIALTIAITIATIRTFAKAGRAINVDDYVIRPRSIFQPNHRSSLLWSSSDPAGLIASLFVMKYIRKLLISL
jgi:hypothetical protein